MNSKNEQALLYEGAARMSVPLTEHAQKTLLDYVNLLSKWNKAYNLTAVREKSDMITRHVLDSLSIVPFVKGERIVDVGSGAGLPGIVLAVYFPDKHFTLVDSNGKKTRFLNEARQALRLNNVDVLQARIEDIQVEGVDCITSRAFAELHKMITLTAHLLCAGGQWLAMKGQVLDEELSTIDKHYKVHVHPLTVYGSDAVRHMVVIEKD